MMKRYDIKMNLHSIIRLFYFYFGTMGDYICVNVLTNSRLKGTHQKLPFLLMFNFQIQFKNSDTNPFRIYRCNTKWKQTITLIYFHGCHNNKQLQYVRSKEIFV